MQADFRPSDVLCPQTFCWVPHERVQAAMLASGSFVSLAALPRVLAGLGAAHGVSADGTPDASATQVHTHVKPAQCACLLAHLPMCLPAFQQCRLHNPPNPCSASTQHGRGSAASSASECVQTVSKRC